MAPVPRWSMVLGKVLGGAAIAMLQGLVFLFLGWITGKIAGLEFDHLDDAARAASPRSC